MTSISDAIAYAKAAERIHAVPAALNIATAMVESGLGLHTPPGSNNWHGIKGSGPATDTREQTAGGVWYTIKSGFHMFKTPGDSFMYYAWLISHGFPYAISWKYYLASDRTDLAVEALTRNIAKKYATALAYSNALIRLEETDHLFQFDGDTSGIVVPALTKTAPAEPGLKTAPAEPGFLTKASDTMGMIATIMALAPEVEAIGSDAVAAYQAIQAFLGSPAGQSLEKNLSQIFTHTATPGAAVVVEPVGVAGSKPTGIA